MELHTLMIMGIVMILLMVAVIGTVGKDRAHNYDERQELLRGRAYRHSYTTLLIGSGVTIGIQELGLFPQIKPSLLVLAAVFVSAGIYAVFCIMNDAYLGIGCELKPMLRGVAVLIASCALNAYLRIKAHGGLLVDGKVALDTGFFLLGGGLFTVLLAAIGIKLGKQSAEE